MIAFSGDGQPGADPRGTMGLIKDMLKVLERHGYHKADDAHMERAIGLLGDAARIYAGEQDDVDQSGRAQPGGGWISGPSTP